MKLAKRYTGRSRIVSFRNAYHGSTHGALSIQGSEHYRNAFRPLLPDTMQLDFNDTLSLEQIDTKTACVFIEPVQAEAGVICPETGFLDELRKRCNQTGALLIFDEIQTGFGRLGSLFALQKFGVVPDILLLAKALGGGMPLGAFISSSDLMSALSTDPVLGHITTFGGHPVCCAAGLASLNVIIDENLTDNCKHRSESFKRKLIHPAIAEIRGEGLLLAVKLNDPEYIKAVVSKAPEYGLILDYFLFCNDAFRIAPPLTISEEETDIACRQINLLLDEIVKG
jgi:acetylornithine/succinyldiaminopimelate/putrescine aminotransferase